MTSLASVAALPGEGGVCVGSPKRSALDACTWWPHAADLRTQLQPPADEFTAALGWDIHLVSLVGMPLQL